MDASLIRAAHAADAAGQPDKADHLCRRALLADPLCQPALLLAGAIAARRANADEAVILLRRALAYDPGSYDAVRWLASLLVGREGGKEAIQLAQRAVDLRPDEADAHVVLGLAAMAGSEIEMSIRAFERAIELRPDMAGAYHNLGVAFQNDESFDEAAEQFQRAIELSPRLIVAHLHLGTVFLAKNQPEQAIECATRALEISPTSRTARKLLADGAYHAVLGDRGEEHIQKALEQDPDSGFPHALLANRLQDHGKFKEAEASIQRSVDLQPAQGFAYYLLAHNRKFKESDRSQIAAIEKIASEEDLPPFEVKHIHFALGKCYDDLGDYESAMRHLDIANAVYGKLRPEDLQEETDRHAARVQAYKLLQSKELLREYAGIGLESNKPIFIFGMPRSGTTLLEQILSRHSNVAAAGEQSFWRDKRRRVANLEKRVLKVRELKKAGQAYLDLLTSFGTDKPRVIDKWPSNYMHLGILHVIFPNAAFLHARRRPLDTCLSMYMRPFFTSSEVEGNRRKIVEGYKQYLGMMEHWRQVLPVGRIFDVQYERMVEDPAATTRAVLEHCGLEWEDACLHPAAGSDRVKTFSKWQVRQPIYRTSVERWRNYEPWLGIFRELMPADAGA